MIRLLYWTSGRGTGHIKRANALLRGFSQAGLDVQLFIAAGRSRFLTSLHPDILPWQGGPGALSAVIVDHKLDHFPPAYAELSPVCVQLCRIASPAGFPPSLADKTVRISIENCEANRQRGLPYLGCLIDADPAAVLTPHTARTRLSALVAEELEGRLGLAHVNTAEPEAALRFLKKASSRLAGQADTILLSSGHEAIMPELKRYVRRLGSSRIVTASIHPLYPYYAAFNVAYVPGGYNTYCETQLFFPGRCTYDPVKFEDSRPRFKDQQLRCAEMPHVDSVGNRHIARRIMEVARGSPFSGP